MQKVRASGRPVLHLSIHSFTPVLHGKRRDFEFGILYDPKRAGERGFAARLRTALQAEIPGVRVRMNQPYRGVSDGLTSQLRKQAGNVRYSGLELEVNQKLVSGPPVRWAAVQDAVAKAVRRAL